MMLFELLKLMRVFGDYLLIEYLWHVLILPLTNRNGITPAVEAGLAYTELASYFRDFRSTRQLAYFAEPPPHSAFHSCCAGVR